MPLDGKLLARASRALERRRKCDRDAYEARLSEIYAKIPELRRIDGEIAASVIGAVSEALKSGEDVERAVAAIAARNLELQAERAEILVENGYAFDYIDEKFRCPVCRDRGYVGAGVCRCLLELYRAEQARELTGLPEQGSQSFERFDLSFYDARPDPKTAIAPRAAMELVRETCRGYAESFGENSMNLLLIGPPGLGKTYLAVCVAREVAKKSVSVVYETAASVVAHFENQKFSKDVKSQEDGAAQASRCAECGLLVLDDLGAEISTSFSASALYSLINTRLISGKKTVAVTNLGLEELRRRYPSGLISRLEGEFQSVPFYGRDIRIIKKERGL